MITYGKDKTAPEKAEMVKSRLGPYMNGLRSGYRPEPKSKLKLKRNALSIVAKF